MSRKYTSKMVRPVSLSRKLVEEIRTEAKRIDRSFSWVAEYAIEHGLNAVKSIPTIHTVGEE
jgi:hypothetical protein